MVRFFMLFMFSGLAIYGKLTELKNVLYIAAEPVVQNLYRYGSLQLFIERTLKMTSS